MQVGDTLDGKYRLMRQLRSGGMGTVYVAERVALGDQVAVKIILPSQNNDVARARFLREAQAAARIRHPNVVQIFDFGEAGPQTPYFVMEFLDGPTLDDEIRVHKALSVERTLEVFRPICAAVEAGHRRGVLHRDLKPGNVMLSRMDDGREVVKVLDFGLARFTGEDGGEKLTVSGAMVGTYSYMSPEQILSEEISPATDVFSLGIILYELVTGRLPFNGGSSFAVMDRIVAGRYKPAIDLVPDLHAGIARAISAALLVDPKKRPQSPAELMGLVDGNAPIRLDATMVEPDPSTEPRHKTHVVAGPTTNPRESDSDGFSVAGDSEWPEMNCFVCRDAEMEALKSEYQNALAGSARLTIIAGDAGIGKSTL
ncbi:MAG TPA: serine/threonine-protein kinase, partial [Blastocatellia bacterium]|nr:serine/threonine-protein kinase [Blastocatellia bacterium]